MLLYDDACAAGNLTIEKIVVCANWCTSMSANHPPPTCHYDAQYQL